MRLTAQASLSELAEAIGISIEKYINKGQASVQLHFTEA